MVQKEMMMISYVRTMSSRSSPLWWNNTFLLQLLRRRTCEPPPATVHQYCRAAVSRFRSHGYSTSRALQTLGGGRGGGEKWGRSMKLPSVAAAAGYGPSGTPPPPPRFNIFPGWARWLAGSVITLFLPTFWKAKCSELKRIEGEAETMMEGVEHTAEVVEKVAKKAEKITAKMADKLPDGNKLKEVVLVVERFSKATIDDAHLITDIIHKIEALKEDGEKLETLVEPIVEKIVHKEAENKRTTK